MIASPKVRKVEQKNAVPVSIPSYRPSQSGFQWSLMAAAQASLSWMVRYAGPHANSLRGGYMWICNPQNAKVAYVRGVIGDVPEEKLRSLENEAEHRAGMFIKQAGSSRDVRLLSSFTGEGATKERGAMRVIEYLDAVVSIDGFGLFDEPLLIVAAYEARLINLETAKRLGQASCNEFAVPLIEMAQHRIHA